MKCSNCGKIYVQIAQHWNRSECGYPELSIKQKQILRGMALGDGCVANPAKTPYFTTNMTNKEFLLYLKSELDTISLGVEKSKDSEEQAKATINSGFSPNGNIKNFSDVYNFRTTSHKFLEDIRDWYSSGEKKWPYKKLTSIELKMLYVSDGSKVDDKRDDGRPTISICVSNESENREKIIYMFSDFGVEVRWNGDKIYFDVDDSEKLWDEMGDAPPGFKYKW